MGEKSLISSPLEPEIFLIEHRYSASTAQALGLSLWESLACSFAEQCLIALIITLNGRAGAVYHVGFPVLNRSAFGIYSAWWPTFNRAVMSIVRFRDLVSVSSRNNKRESGQDPDEYNAHRFGTE